MNFRILRAILKKDVLSLRRMVALTALLFLADALIVRLELLPLWSCGARGAPGGARRADHLGIPTGFAGQSHGRLAVPAGAQARAAGAKIALVLAAVYLPRAIGTFIADLSLGFPVSEAFLDAVLLPDKLFLFVLPLLIFAAIITRTFVQAFGVLFAIFICVFVIPTPFVRPPGPLDSRYPRRPCHLRHEWLATTPARLASLALVVLGFWLVYWRRSLTLARVLMVAHRLRHVVPVAAADGIDAVEIHVRAASGLRPGAGRGLSAHFLAQPAHLLPRRNARPAVDRRGVRRRPGTACGYGATEELRDAGPNSVAFLTAIEARGLPLDWRVKLNYVQADYSAGGGPLVIACDPPTTSPTTPAVDRWRMPGCCRKARCKNCGACSPNCSSHIH